MDYKLLKDTPIDKAGTIFKKHPVHHYTYNSGNSQYPYTVVENNLEWFEPIKELPKSLDELKNVKGWVINNGRAVYVERTGNHDCHQNHIFGTEAQAKSAIALAQLSLLAKELNGGEDLAFVMDGRNYVVDIDIDEEIAAHLYERIWSPIVFKTYELAQFSAEHHKSLWKEYFVLLT